MARFSEVKSLYSEGDLTGTDEDGEEININRVQEALRAAGVDMTEFLKGNEGLDQVLLRLSERWDTLDVLTQRFGIPSTLLGRNQFVEALLGGLSYK